MNQSMLFAAWLFAVYAATCLIEAVRFHDPLMLLFALLGCVSCASALLDVNPVYRVQPRRDSQSLSAQSKEIDHAIDRTNFQSE